MNAWFEPRILAAAVLAGLALSFAAATAHAQPSAMPITVLDNGDSAADPLRGYPAASATEPDSPSQFLQAQYEVAQPGPMFSAGQELPAPQCPPVAGPPPAGFDMPPTELAQPACWATPWTWQVLPDGLMYKNYLASNEEARLGTQLYYSKQLGWMWDSNLGGHVGIIRYGTQDAAWPEGWQADAEGVALVRLDGDRSIVDSDFRFGFPLTWREGPWEFKFGYYHLSSHLGDIYIENHPGIERISYKREQLVMGLAYRPVPSLRFYGEANWAFNENGGSRPWEFQFGIDYSPVQPNGFCRAVRRDEHEAHGRRELLRQLHRRGRLAVARANRPHAPHGPGVLQRLQLPTAVLQRLAELHRRGGMVRFLSTASYSSFTSASSAVNSAFRSSDRAIACPSTRPAAISLG